MKKSFIITIDTESDNQWMKTSNLTTINARYLPRFQKLCEKYKFKPVYLTDYSMASDEYFVDFVKDCLNRNVCEIGMHLHAWGTPPYHIYDSHSINKPYLIEYPVEMMRNKIIMLTNKLEEKFGCKIISHRAGRWAINDEYLEILGECGYKVDCSVTPGVNWRKQKGANIGGSDYSNAPSNSYLIHKKYNILEVPMTIRKLHLIPELYSYNLKDFVKNVAHCLLGKNIWLRPSISSRNEINHLMGKLALDNSSYAEFMMHSSEFMPNGSPYYTDENAIEMLFENLDLIFEYISNSYEGKTLAEYYKEFISEN